MEKSPKFEIIYNGKVVDVVKGWDALENTEKEYSEKAHELGMRPEVKSSCGSSGYILWFNDVLLLSMTYAWREVTEFKDVHGNPIYYGDHLSIGLEFFSLNHSEYLAKETDGWYLRNLSHDGADIPITGEEIRRRYSVFHRVFPEIKNELEAKNG